MVDLTMVIKGVLYVIFGLVLAYGFPALDSLKKYITTCIGAKNYTMIVATIQAAVRAAEQIYGAGNGQIKKAEVLERVNEFLNAHNLSMDAYEVDSLIESFVLQLPKAVKAE